LQKLTTLRLHPGRDATIELDEFDALLRSSNLPNLTHLQVHMTTFGDDGAAALVKSGILRRLKVLDIAYGNMTDEGARLLAKCPDLKHLDVLNVSENALTSSGVTALSATGIQVVADAQHEVDEQAYLYEVDVE
jgi:Ran GTPase-activating protein (RanGAP) involved in mRNA processing and transport